MISTRVLSGVGVQCCCCQRQRRRLSKDHEVLCELVSPEWAVEVSIAENSGREPLRTAGEFDAFKALIDEGKRVEDIAARFGLSVLTVLPVLPVRRRLKLANLATSAIRQAGKRWLQSSLRCQQG